MKPALRSNAMIRRRKSGAIVCPTCGSLVDVNAARCLSCKAWRPGVFGYGPLLVRVRKLPSRELIVGFCAIMYLASLFLSRRAGAEPGSIFEGLSSLSSPTRDALLTLGATGRIPIAAQGRWETLLTAVFLHGNLLHLLFNCLWAWQLAPEMEEFYDSARFFLIFIAAGAAGNLLSVALDRSAILIGASGGVYGLFGALVWYGFKRGGVVGSRVLSFGLMWAGAGLAISLLVPHVALWAHAGGFAAGFAAAAVLGYEEARRSGPWLCLIAVCAGLAVLVAFIAHLAFPPEGLAL